MSNSSATPAESSFDLYSERTIIDGLFLGAIAYGEDFIDCLTTKHSETSSRDSLDIIYLGYEHPDSQKEVRSGLLLDGVHYSPVHHGKHREWNQYQGWRGYFCQHEEFPRRT